MVNFFFMSFKPAKWSTSPLWVSIQQNSQLLLHEFPSSKMVNFSYMSILPLIRSTSLAWVSIQQNGQFLLHEFQSSNKVNFSCMSINPAYGHFLLHEYPSSSPQSRGAGRPSADPITVNQSWTQEPPVSRVPMVKDIRSIFTWHMDGRTWKSY